MTGLSDTTIPNLWFVHIDKIKYAIGSIESQYNRYFQTLERIKLIGEGTKTGNAI
jgi:hypothetical protein